MGEGPEFITNEAEVGLPPLQRSRKAVWDYYRIEFLPDGYPGRRMGEQLFAHPIYGPYVIADYIAQYRQTRNATFLDAAARVADAAVAQMTPVGDGLAFMYSQKGTAVSSRTGTFYSGLTQSRYIEAFRKLAVLPGGKRFQEPLSAIAKSLLIPADRGGVARFTAKGGLVIEEYPSLVPDCTLNGWTTATCILRDYALSTDDDQAWQLFRQSVRGLEELVPLYDVPELANSRYRLTGVASIRFTAGVDLEVIDCKVDMPGYGEHVAARAGDPAGEALREGPLRVTSGRPEVLKVSLSRLTWPSPNRLLLSVRASHGGSADVAIGDGRYAPLSKDLPVEYYRHLETFDLRQGENQLVVEVPWVDAELISYPTGFGKAIAGRQFNQYHWIHVDTLSKIVDETGSELLRYYRDRWRRYPERWKDLPEYQDDRITLERFDPKKHR